MWKRLAHTASTALVVIGLTTVLFIVVNLTAFAFIQWSPREALRENGEDILSYALDPRTPEGEAILVDGLGESSAARIRAAYDNLQTPAFAPHPVLHYIVQPTKNSHYTVGREGIRYINGWTHGEATALLQSARNKVFLMGGSTTFGHGVDDDDTIAAHLQRQLGNEYAVFNFGTAAYDQIREIDRLLYHLRQGHRPDVVAFLDGINDAFSLARSNYRLEDKIVYHGFVAGRGSLPGSDRSFALETERSVAANDFLVMLAYALPFTRVLLERMQPRPDMDSIPAVVDAFESRLDYDAAGYVFSNWASFAEKHRERLKGQAREYYDRNLRFLTRLADAFGFTLLVFYQPNGLLDPLNPMRGDPPESAPGLRYLREVQQTVRGAIRGGRWPMIDITDGLSALSREKRAYIDAEHYTPPANEAIARIYGGYILGAAAAPDEP